LDVSIGVPAGIERMGLTPASGQRGGLAATQYESGVMTYRSGSAAWRAGGIWASSRVRRAIPFARSMRSSLDLAELGLDGIKPAETGRPAYPRPEQTRTAVMFYNWKGRVLQTPFPAHAGVLDSFPF